MTKFAATDKLYTIDFIVQQN